MAVEAEEGSDGAIDSTQVVRTRKRRKRKKRNKTHRRSSNSLCDSDRDQEQLQRPEPSLTAPPRASPSPPPSHTQQEPPQHRSLPQEQVQPRPHSEVPGGMVSEAGTECTLDSAQASRATTSPLPALQDIGATALESGPCLPCDSPAPASKDPKNVRKVASRATAAQGENRVAPVDGSGTREFRQAMRQASQLHGLPKDWFCQGDTVTIVRGLHRGLVADVKCVIGRDVWCVVQSSGDQVRLRRDQVLIKYRNDREVNRELRVREARHQTLQREGRASSTNLHARPSVKGRSSRKASEPTSFDSLGALLAGDLDASATSIAWPLHAAVAKPVHVQNSDLPRAGRPDRDLKSPALVQLYRTAVSVRPGPLRPRGELVCE